MNYYREAVAGKFRPYFGETERSNTFPNIGNVLIRAGSGKGRFIGNTLADMNVDNTLIIPSDWDEDGFKAFPIDQQRLSIMKVSDRGRDMRKLLGERGMRPHLLTVGLATDVLTTYEGVELTKPLSATTREEVADNITNVLSGQKETDIDVKVSAACLVREASQTDGQSSGLVTSVRHRIQVAPLALEEIDLYVFGLQGREGTQPPALRRIFDDLTNRFSLDPEEITLLAKGLTLDQLKQSNLGIRWPHPLIQQHILNVNGIQVGEPQFDKALLGLYYTLLGAPVELRDMLRVIDNGNCSQNLPNTQPNLYPELGGNWTELVRLKRGEHALVCSLTPGDYPEVSNLTKNNFYYAPNYQYLTPVQKEAYANANSVEGIYGLMANNSNACSLIARSIDGRPLGYIVVKGRSDGTAQTKRLHVELGHQGSGLGSALLKRAEQIVRDKGYIAMEVQASGSSNLWFEFQGYDTRERKTDGNGVFTNVSDPPVYYIMRKDI